MEKRTVFPTKLKLPKLPRNRLNKRMKKENFKKRSIEFNLDKSPD